MLKSRCLGVGREAELIEAAARAGEGAEGIGFPGADRAGGLPRDRPSRLLGPCAAVVVCVAAPMLPRELPTCWEGAAGLPGASCPSKATPGATPGLRIRVSHAGRCRKQQGRAGQRPGVPGDPGPHSAPHPWAQHREASPSSNVGLWVSPSLGSELWRQHRDRLVYGCVHGDG